MDGRRGRGLALDEDESSKAAPTRGMLKLAPRISDFRSTPFDFSIFKPHNFTTSISLRTLQSDRNMLKSTHERYQPPEVPAPPPLPPGWTEHVAPAGHTYYYNAETKKSTYTRPVPEAGTAQIPSYGSGQFAGGFSQTAFPHHLAHHGTQNGGGGGHGFPERRRMEPADRPKHKYKIPESAPWVLVKTKLGRRFVYNSDSGESFWKFPAEVMKGVVEFDRIEREKKERRERGDPSGDEPAIVVEELQVVEEAEQRRELKQLEPEEEEDGSDYTEVTDDEEEGEEGRSKKQRTEEVGHDGPIEFNEDDIAAELEEMGQDYGLDQGEYGFDDGTWEEGAEGIPLTEEDSKVLFFELLEDLKINPYSTWEKVIEEGRIIDDSRYTALPNMKSRRLVWDQWSTMKMQQLKEAKEKQEKKDPRIPYFAFLETNASTKLYWPEFKRKFRKDQVMKDTKLVDKDREKWYREYVKRLQLPRSTLVPDFTSLLKSLPVSQLNRDTSLAALPAALLTDMRYISLAPSVREPLISTYIPTLPPAPESALSAEQEEEAAAKRQDKERREKALAERERRVEEEKRKQRRDLEFGKGRLREEERELERAMRISKSGLKTQLVSAEEVEDAASKPD
jgi:hypothetical protein